MLDINWIKANPAAFDKGLRFRRSPYSSEYLIQLDKDRREALSAEEALNAKRKSLSAEVHQAKAKGDDALARTIAAEVTTLKDELDVLQTRRRDAEASLESALLEVPNVPLDDVPSGADETDNVEYFGRNGSSIIADRPKKPVPGQEMSSGKRFPLHPKEHFQIGEQLGGMDFEVAAKLAGSRFVVLKSHLARLERAIGQFMLDLHTDLHGYTEILPPLLVNAAAMRGTGQLPKFDEDLFKTEVFSEDAIARIAIEYAKRYASDRAIDFVKNNREKVIEFMMQHGSLHYADHLDELIADDHEVTIAEGSRRAMRLIQEMKAENRKYLIPTAEVPLTNLVAGLTVAEDALPLRYTALTPCFRSEAGSAGRDTRGMLRQHQFNKVEMVSITTPEASGEEHEKMLSDAEDVLQQLGIHYRVMKLSTGDMGFGAQKTYDIEAWLPGQDTYREISSVSVCGDFQARRMKARFKTGDGKTKFVHTLNGSGVAVGRALIAVMENYQQEDGSVLIPEVLQPYMKGLKSIGAKS